jgi:ligand-binding sensor domain-containing protein/signal transduction histidine kinase
VSGSGRRRWLWLPVLGVASAWSAFAGGGLAQYSSRLWQMQDGLPHNVVQALAQTQDGYLWVGTREGLARFDGVQFEPVNLPAEARHPSVLSLRTARDGSLWIGTARSGLFHAGRSSISRCEAPGGSTNLSAYEIHEGGDGAVWVATSVGVLRYRDGKLERVSDFRSLIESLCADTRGRIWIARDGGLECLSEPSRPKLVPEQGSLPREPRRLYCDPDGVFWVASKNGLTELKNGVARFYPKSEGPQGFINAFCRDSLGNLWIGAYAGLSRFADGEFVNEEGRDEASYHVYAFMEDRERNLWVASEQGLERLTPKPFRTYTKKDGLSLNTVVSVCASHDGSVWVSAWGGGLNHLVDGRFDHVRAAEGLSSDFVMALLEGRDGSLWVGADYGAALNRIQNGAITHYGREQGYTAGAITALFEDPSGLLWIGTRDGLFCLRDGRISLKTTRDGLSHDKINALCGAQQGGMWIGTERGLTRWDGQHLIDYSGKEASLRNTILSLYEDPEGALWIGTRDQGVLQLRQEKVRAFTSREGLFSDSLYAILEDGRGNLWFNGSRGIFRAAKRQFSGEADGTRILCINYGKIDGVMSTGQYEDEIQPSACKGTDGRLWFRTTPGVAVVDPGQVTINELPPPVLIQEVIADGKRLGLPLNADAPFPGTGTDGSPSPPLAIKPGRGELEIHCAALSFRAPEKNQFRYKLDGLDLDWVEAGERRVAYYNNLRPGTYRFQVIACNNDGVWNPRGASLSLVLRPHFWQTWWFEAAGLVAAAGLVGGTTLFVTRKRTQRQLAQLEQQRAIERERTRIARDMHDELGAKLTRIFFQGASARRSASNPEAALQVIDNMSSTARDLVTSLDEIVWAVDPENDSLEDLANYTCRYATEFFQNSPMTCRVLIPTDLPHRRLPTDLRHNLFLAVKEALHNALKHSGGSRAELSITGGQTGFEILISDDGRGMPAAEKSGANGLKRTGHGLVNIEERMASIGGRVEFKSQPGQGTEVRLWVPFPKASA